MDPDPHGLVRWIRILFVNENPDLDPVGGKLPTKIDTVKKFFKYWMFSFENRRLLHELGRASWRPNDKKLLFLIKKSNCFFFQL